MKQEPQRTEEDIVEEFATKLSKAIDTELIRQKYKNRANIKDGGRVICEIVFVKWFEDTLHSYTAQREQAVRDDFDLMVKKTHDIATQNGYALAIKHFEERISKGQEVFDAIEGMKNVHRKKALTPNDTDKV